MNLKNIIKVLISIPKSMIINYKSLPFATACKLPVLVAYNTKVLSLKGKIIVQEPCFGKIRIGFGGAGSVSTQRSIIENNGTIIFNGKVSMGGGSRLCTVNQKSSIVFGENTYFMGDTNISASELITFGSDCLISWGTQFLDTDFHKIFTCGKGEEEHINQDKPIIIEDNVWIASNVSILKGTRIPEGVVIASGSIISKSIDCGNCVVSGMPIKILKKNIYWKP